MKKILLVIALMASNQASASFWDSVTGFFSSSEPETEAVKEEVVKMEAEAESAENSAVLDNIPQKLALVDTLVQSLSVSEAQATGGMGAILNQAKSGLTTEKFGLIEQYIPNADSLLAAVPAISSDGKGLTDMMGQGSLKESANKIASASQVVQQFSAMGLSPDMIGQFIEVATGFLSQSGGSEASALLTSSLGAFL